MRYVIYKLKFNTFMRAGIDKGNHGLENTKTTIASDTFFSALCSEIISVYGESALKDFIEKAKQGKITISDLLPYVGEDLFIPRPVIPYQKILQQEGQIEQEKIDAMKKMKDIKFISLDELDEYFKCMVDGRKFEPKKTCQIFKKEAVWKNSIDKESIAEPYVVSGTAYKENTGLYFILGTDDDIKIDMDEIIESLSVSGIGGKKSIGFGKFELEEDPIEIFFDDEDYYVYKSDSVLKEKLLAAADKCDYYFLLSTLIPDFEDISDVKEGWYALIKRSGFVYSKTYSDRPLKKRQIIAIASGSAFKTKVAGSMKDLSKDGNHPVYRFGKGLYLGVNTK